MTGELDWLIDNCLPLRYRTLSIPTKNWLIPGFGETLVKFIFFPSTQQHVDQRLGIM
jgi:hypothetical protein